MKNIIEALGLNADATEDQAVAAITALQAEVDGAKKLVARIENAAPTKETAAREKVIFTKMAAGLNRETAEEAVRNQEQEDARVEALDKKKK